LLQFKITENATLKSRVFLFLLDNNATQTTEIFMIEIALLEQQVSTLDDDFLNFGRGFTNLNNRVGIKKLK